MKSQRYNNRIMESLNIKNKLESSYILKLKDILKNAGIMSDISSQKVWLLYTFSREESFASIPLPPVFQLNIYDRTILNQTKLSQISFK